MTYRVVVRPEVDADLSEAEAWYEQQEAGLGREFLRAVRDTVDTLSSSPLIYNVRSKRKQVRWAYSQRFPYRIIFRVISDTVVIYAVVHIARHDRQWSKRL
ncbi:MAG: toxin ParE1/3/4 [Blastocatellia bacterium]|nr:toxin ParE1/3/4 [Blastocatellia bacterium]